MNEITPIAGITPFKLSPGRRVAFGGQVYECIERAAAEKKLINISTKAETWIKNRQLVVMMTTGELKLVPHASTPECRHKLQQVEFGSLPEPVKRRAYLRRDYAEALIENARLGYPRRVKEVLQAVFRRRIADPDNAGEWRPSTGQAYEWKRIWECCGRKGISNLVFAESIRAPRGLRGSELVKELMIEAIIAKFMTAQRNQVSVTHDALVGLCRSNGVSDEDIPCARTVRRAIRDLSPYAVARARRGQRAADLEYQSVGKLPGRVFPGEALEVDAHMLDIVVVDEQGFMLGRLWITTAIDRCTRMIVGFHLHLEPPSSITVAACLRNAIAPKLYMLRRWPEIGREWVCWGVPLIVIVDNALENKAEFLLEAADELGFTIHWAPPRTPEYKPYIERWHLTLTAQFECRIPGNTGSSPSDRGDYDTKGLACATLDDIDELMHRWVVTVYNRTHHRGINDIPERLWIELTSRFEVEPFDDIERLDVLLGHIAYRKIHHYGIELGGIRYGDLGNNRTLEMLRTRQGAGTLEKVKIRFDPTDLSCIHVQDPDSLRYYRIDSLDPEYTNGLTLARHRIIRRFAKERSAGYITVNELCLARDTLQQCINEILGDPHASGRKKAAILNGIGSKGSWGPFYRHAVDEYGGFKKSEQTKRTIVELLDGEWREVEQPTAGSELITALGEQPSSASDDSPEAEPTPPLTAEAHLTDFKARAAARGITLEGL